MTDTDDRIDRKIRYEIYLQAPAHWNPQDFETIEWDDCRNYRDAVRKAKAYSAKLPFKDEKTGRMFVRVAVAAYNQTENTTYNLVWMEEYRGGKGLGREYSD